MSASTVHPVRIPCPYADCTGHILIEAQAGPGWGEDTHKMVCSNNVSGEHVFDYSGRNDKVPAPSARPVDVVRKLKAGGFAISPSARKYRYEGVFVSRGIGNDRSVVRVHLDRLGERKRISAALLACLQAADYAVSTILDENGVEATIFVSKNR